MYLRLVLCWNFNPGHVLPNSKSHCHLQCWGKVHNRKFSWYGIFITWIVLVIKCLAGHKTLNTTQCLEVIFTWQQNSGADGAFSADDEKAQWRKPSWFPTTQINLTGDSKKLFWFPTHKQMQQTNKHRWVLQENTAMCLSLKRLTLSTHYSVQIQIPS